MRVNIRGVTTISGISQLAVGGRFFPVDSTGRIVEVLEQEDDPPPVLIPVHNSTTNAMVPTERPDPDRMGKKSYEEILKDGRFAVLAVDVVDSRAADAAVAVSRSEQLRLAGENADLKVANAQLEAQVEDRDRTIATLQASIVELKSEHEGLMEQLEAQTAPQTKAEAKAQAKADAKDAKGEAAAAAKDASGPHEAPK